MPYEVPLIRDLGFEVYVPKIIPNKNFRSAAVTFDYDQCLSIPKKVLDRLNSFDFYLTDWPPDIIRLLNRYFGTIFIIPYGRQVIEAVTHFDGEIVFRAFGLDNRHSYNKVLEDMYGRGFRHRLESVKERFWFGEGYDHLHEVESTLFKDKSLFLPIGIPSSFFRNEGKWRGTRKEILFVAPNVVTDSYYAKIYKDFKRDFGDLPHVIVGHQDAPIDDPHVAGFVTDEELQSLYLDCAALYYHSREARHVHYSPVEAAISGMPIVYFQDSLLGRMCPGSVKGCVTSVGQAREVLQKILSGDEVFIADIREDQRDVAYHFSDAYCRPVWKENLEKSGILENLAKQSLVKTTGRELHRSAARIVGRTLDNSESYRPLPSADIAKEVTGSSLADGIFFNHAELPACVTDIQGLSGAETWGRWSDAERVVISLNHMLDKEFILDVAAVGYDRNAGADIKVKIGNSSNLARFGADMNNAQTVSLPFRLKKPTNVIELTVPYPTKPVKDSRSIGLGLVSLNVRPLAGVPEASQEARPLAADAAKMQECRTFIEAGIVAAAVPEVVPAMQPDTGAAAAGVGSDRRPAWRRAARVLVRRARPVLLPFSHRFRGHVRTAIEETEVLPQLSQVMSELTSLRHEIVSLRGALDSHVRQFQIDAKADRATLSDMAAVLSDVLNRPDGIEAAPARSARTFEVAAKGADKGTDRLPVEGP
ncbi:DUF7024 domain-containing protein [Microvirga aerophila]|uniref:DUF7024 domain-containing protein n=2 Tax=Microvirga aerophila TaxID=670291 RepID=A0A512BRJ3_9HYPH|nr:hypothetical protein [Microvirga aerophila]GEO14619.1 hypothetical protein MAE02_23150 [Microvirga aerophila]